MRYKKSVERIGTLGLLKMICVAHHPRCPIVEGVVACERLGQLLGPIDGKRLGWLTLPRHTHAQNKKPASDKRCGRM